MLRTEHERRSEQLDREQQLEIDNLMFLLSRDAKEKCEGSWALRLPTRRLERLRVVSWTIEGTRTVAES
jgi:hypothetical protein